MTASRRGPCAAAVWVTGVLAAALLGTPRAAAADTRGEVQRTLTLLNVVGEEYREGVVDGQVVLPVEYGEAQAFVDEAEQRLRAAVPAAAAATAPAFAELRQRVAGRAPLDRVRAALDAVRTAVTQQTGVEEEIYPPAAPSAARGRALFAENCTPCHGTAADGHGPEAAKLSPPPANFTDPEFMRRETPFSFFNIITAGKGTSAMPAWGDVFSLQERWDLVSYLYTVEPAAAQRAAGEQTYAAECAGCHGRAGSGSADPVAAHGSIVPAIDTPAALARRTDAELIAIITEGLPGAGMPGFSGRLGDEQIAATAAYVRALSLGGAAAASAAAGEPDTLRRFSGLVRLISDEYRKAVAPDAPPRPLELTETDILIEQLRAQAPRAQAALIPYDPALASALPDRVARIAATVRERRPAGELVSLTGPLAESVAAQVPGGGAGGGEDPAAQLAAARRALDEAHAAYRAGDPRAVYLVSDAYFLFDPLEKRIRLRDAELARRAEARFADLRGLIAAPDRPRDVARALAALDADLEAARAALVPQPLAYGVAVQSALIILREGFEIVLIVGALLAYVRKSGVPEMRPPIVWGTVAGAAASVVSAYVLGRLFAASGATAEVIEGATMLLAAAVLFFVSYWLISKAEAERWQRYIQGKVKHALATGNALALAGAAFLAVYREGVETVLFYEALIDSSPGALVPVLGGLACGAAALGIVYVLYMRLGTRLPTRQFFLATGGVLYYLAVVFAGNGVAELQGAGWISTTPIAWLPRVEAIGLSPTLETVVAQAALLLCVVYAIVVTARRARRERAAAGVPMNIASPGSAKL
jgi:high-affinity iron transporter